eukprot:TRINITY_DN46667_c0_g1_i2.p1 TRINITY_DN46667_c0_g1~~TRINITY_DN46667_c0_g1_i2.p1  ORF type:complete len:451 (+),score=34.64 TRINITY_DN46667_c0_g1_i2:415-1767(+)
MRCSEFLQLRPFTNLSQLSIHTYDTMSATQAAEVRDKWLLPNKHSLTSLTTQTEHLKLFEEGYGDERSADVMWKLEIMRVHTCTMDWVCTYLNPNTLKEFSSTSVGVATMLKSFPNLTRLEAEAESCSEIVATQLLHLTLHCDQDFHEVLTPCQFPAVRTMSIALENDNFEIAAALLPQLVVVDLSFYGGSLRSEKSESFGTFLASATNLHSFALYMNSHADDALPCAIHGLQQSGCKLRTLELWHMATHPEQALCSLANFVADDQCAGIQELTLSIGPFGSGSDEIPSSAWQQLYKSINNLQHLADIRLYNDSAPEWPLLRSTKLEMVTHTFRDETTTVHHNTEFSFVVPALQQLHLQWHCAVSPAVVNKLVDQLTQCVQLRALTLDFGDIGSEQVQYLLSKLPTAHLATFQLHVPSCARGYAVAFGEQNPAILFHCGIRDWRQARVSV